MHKEKTPFCKKIILCLFFFCGVITCYGRKICKQIKSFLEGAIEFIKFATRPSRFNPKD